MRSLLEHRFRSGLTIALASACIAACHATTVGQSANGTAVTPEAAGPNCSYGGVKVQVTGDSASYVCNGAPGASGAEPVVSIESSGNNCSYGGVEIQVGTGTPSYLCNGAPGASGPSAIITPAGANCANGGIAVQAGSGAPSYVCNGASGAKGSDGAGAIITTDDIHCTLGGLAVKAGDGTVSYVCSGAPSPCVGDPALSVTEFTMSSGSPYTATVTVSYAGVNTLTYSFLGEGGSYAPTSSDQFSFTPTVSGGPYTNYVLVSDGCQMAMGSLAGIYTPPADVSDVVATPGDSQVTLTWVNPTSANFDHVQISGAGFATVETSGDATTATITGLTNGQSYTFLLQAMDALGDSSAGVSVSATPLSPVRVFVSINGADGDFTVTQANAECQSEGGPFGGTWIALLSTVGAPAAGLLQGMSGPVYNLSDDALLASDVASFFATPLLAPITQYDSGPARQFWSGSEDPTADLTCIDWTIGILEAGIVGTVGFTAPDVANWFEAGTNACLSFNTWLCISQ